MNGTVITLTRNAYTMGALIDAGIPLELARTLLADGPRAIPERALLQVGGRKRTPEPITSYVWGPDALVLLREVTERQPQNMEAA